MQRQQEAGEKDWRTGNVTGAWKDRVQPVNKQIPQYVKRPTMWQWLRSGVYGVDFDDPKIQQLGNDPSIYTFNSKEGPYYDARIDRINYSQKKHRFHTMDDVLAALAHETAHRRTEANGYRRSNVADSREYGYWDDELPSIINEWTYGQAQGTVHPLQMKPKDSSAGRLPMRQMGWSENRKPDAYYNNLFPSVYMRDLHSEPGKEYRYWHAPGEPNTPSNYAKRLVYETPNGYWVNPEGKWVQTGADVFDPNYLDFSNNINVAYLPPNLQRFIHNIGFLRLAQPAEERQKEIQKARETLQDLFSVLALRREYTGSEGRTLADMIRNTLGFVEGINTIRNAKLYHARMEDAGNHELEGLINEYYDLLTDATLYEYTDKYKSNPRYGNIPYSRYTDLPKLIEQKPWWSPEAVNYPMIPELAEMQKKYAISPTLDEPTDVRDLIQLQAMIDEAIQIYQRRRAWEKEEGLKGDPNWQEDPKDPRWLLLDSLMNPPEE